MKQSSKFWPVILLFVIIPVVSKAIDPKRDYELTPDSVRATYESMSIKTTDGFSINTWIYFPTKEKDNNHTIILAYPDKGNMGNWVYFAAAFVNKGYSVVTFDYRGFGKSSDFPINRDFQYHTEFVIDLTTVCKEIDKKFPEKKIGIWALSMGTIITTLAMPDLKKNIDFIIGDGFVTDLKIVVDRIERIKNDITILPESNTDYVKCLRNIKAPLLIFAASKDQITTSNDALLLKKIKKGIYEIIIYEGEHLRGFQAGKGAFGEYYINEITQFIEKHSI